MWNAIVVVITLFALIFSPIFWDACKFCINLKAKRWKCCRKMHHVWYASYFSCSSLTQSVQTCVTPHNIWYPLLEKHVGSRCTSMLFRGCTELAQHILNDVWLPSTTRTLSTYSESIRTCRYLCHWDGGFCSQLTHLSLEQKSLRCRYVRMLSEYIGLCSSVDNVHVMDGSQMELKKADDRLTECDGGLALEK